MIKHRYKPPTITQHPARASTHKLAHRYKPSTRTDTPKRKPTNAHLSTRTRYSGTQAPANARAYTHAHAYKRTRTQEKNEKKPSVIGWVLDQCMAIAIKRPFSSGIPHAWPLPVHDPHAPGHGKTLISPIAFRIAAFVSCVP